jgi:hypothetical protein
MKTFKEYLSESKKTYGFRIKVAGPLPEGFEDKAKSKMGKYGCGKFEKVASTPIQKTALEFLDLSNIEVTVFECECSYPVTPQQVQIDVHESTGISNTHLRVRNVNDPFEQAEPVEGPSGKALLNDSELKDAEKIKHKENFGNEFTAAFLKDIAKVSKERTKENNQGEYKMPKAPKQDKAGTKSALGS